jgi:hypothetical protein
MVDLGHEFEHNLSIDLGTAIFANLIKYLLYQQILHPITLTLKLHQRIKLSLIHLTNHTLYLILQLLHHFLSSPIRTVTSRQIPIMLYDIF